MRTGLFLLTLLVAAARADFFPEQPTVAYDSMTTLSPIAVQKVLVDRLVPDAFGFADGGVRLFLHAAGGGDVKGHAFQRGWTKDGQTVTLYDLKSVKGHHDIGAFNTVEFIWQPILPPDFKEGQTERQSLTFLDGLGHRVAQVSALTTVRVDQVEDIKSFHLVLSDVKVTR
jgi:hypothetical protein